MRSFVFNIIFFLFLGIAFHSCSKVNQSILPDATHHGANTMGCIIDGYPYYAEDGKVKDNVGFFSRDCYWRCSWDEYPNKGGRLNFEFCETVEISNFIIYLELNVEQGKTFNSIHDSMDIHLNLMSKGQFQLDRNNPLFITITHLTPEIIAGTFYGSAVNNNGDIIKIEEGRFDLKRKK